MVRNNYVAHLVGSIPLEDTEGVLRTVAKSLGNNLRRIPDGETGKRLGWIKFMENYFNNLHPDMETDEQTPYLKWRQWDGELLREPLLVVRRRHEVREHRPLQHHGHIGS